MSNTSVAEEEGIEDFEGTEKLGLKTATNTIQFKLFKCNKI